MIIETALWYLAFGGGAAWMIKKLSPKRPPTEQQPTNGEPPDPGPFDGKKYRTQDQINEWVIAHSARVYWERTQPKKPIPPPKDGQVVRLRQM